MGFRFGDSDFANFGFLAGFSRFPTWVLFVAFVYKLALLRLLRSWYNTHFLRLFLILLVCCILRVGSI